LLNKIPDEEAILQASTLQKCGNIFSECQGRLILCKLMKQYAEVLLLSLFKAPDTIFFFFFETVKQKDQGRSKILGDNCSFRPLLSIDLAVKT